MKDFWDEVWDYLGKCRKDISCRYITDMWEAKDAMGATDGCDYELLCYICRNLAKETKRRLPENLHSRIVLGVQNSYTLEYLMLYGV